MHIGVEETQKDVATVFLCLCVCSVLYTIHSVS